MRLWPHPLGAIALASLLVASAATEVCASGAAPSRKSAISEIYLTFDPFEVSVLENYRVRGLLTLEIALAVHDSELRHKADKQKARLRDAFVRALISYGTRVAQVTRPPDLDAISEKLQAETDDLLGHAGARVLILQAYLRRTG